MSKDKITLVKQPDGSHVIEASFNIGQITEARKPGAMTISLAPSVESAMFGLTAVLQNFDRTSPDWQTAWDDAMDQYCRYWMLDKLGLTQHPLQYNAEGGINGLKGEYEVKESGEVTENDHNHN